MTTGLLERFGKSAGQWTEKEIKKKIDDAPQDVGTKIGQNLWGRMCTAVIKDEKWANRCKALDRLPDIAVDGTAAFGSCAAAETGIGALACGYYSAKTGDEAGAMTHQLATGEETKTLQERGEDYGMEKLKEAGAYVKEKASEEFNRQLYEAQKRPIQGLIDQGAPQHVIDQLVNDPWGQ
jgi:hypothetical protein